MSNTKNGYTERELDVTVNESYDNEVLDIAEEEAQAESLVSDEDITSEGSSDDAEAADANSSAEQGKAGSTGKNGAEKSFASALGFTIASGVFAAANIVFICLLGGASGDLSMAFSILVSGVGDVLIAGISMTASVMLMIAYGVCSLILSIIVLVLARYARKHADGVLIAVSLCEMILSGVLAVIPIIIVVSAVVGMMAALA